MEPQPENQTDSPLRISRLLITDFGCIEELDIQPQQQALVILKGDNAQGKTCALTALAAVLMGKRGDPALPIREGCEKATVSLTLADQFADRYAASVTWTQKRRYLTVKEVIPGTGGTLKKLRRGATEQSFLTDLAASLSFRALDFMDMKPEKRLPALLEATGQEDAYLALVEARKGLFEKRTNVNRLATAAGIELAAHPDPSPSKELAPVATDQLTKTLQEATVYDAEIDTRARSVASFRSQLAAFVGDIDAKKIQRDALQAEIVAGEERIVAGRAKLAAAEAEQAQMERTRVGPEGAAKEIQAATEHNEKCQQQRLARTLIKDKLAHTTAADQLTTSIAETDSQIRGLLSGSSLAERLPLLKVAADGSILYDGKPLESASGMQRLQISCLIGMALNPRLHVMRIDEGDMLDAAAMQQLLDIAHEHDYQVWMSAIYAGVESERALTIRMHAGRSPDSAEPSVLVGQSPDEQKALDAMYAPPTAVADQSPGPVAKSPPVTVGTSTKPVPDLSDL